MSLTATFDDTAGRVRLVVASAPGTADTTLFERSIDGGTTWTTVRGGAAVSLAAGACQLDDYEYPAGRLTTYRASYVDAAAPALVAYGAFATPGNNTSVTPGMPAGVAVGDALFCVAAINDNAATIPTPAGWSRMIDQADFVVFARRYATGVTAPTITFGGGGAGDDTQAVIVAVRNAEAALDVSAFQLNGSQQNIPYPGITVGATPSYGFVAMRKQASSTGLSPAASASQSSTAGTGQTLALYGITTTTPAGTVTVTGGVSAQSKVIDWFARRAAYVTQETAAITPVQTGVWIKNIGRAYLSRKVTVTDIGDETTPARGGIQNILGRTYPIAVTDVRGGRSLALQVTTATLQAADDLSACLAAGDAVFLQPPSTTDCPIPTGYFWLGDVQRSKHSRRTVRRFFDLPMVEVAAPSSAIVPITATWSSVLSTYATWTAELAGKATWSAVIDMTGVPDVVVS